MTEVLNLSFKPILDKAYDEEITTVTVQAARILSAKSITKVMKILSSKVPIPKLQHLKRVKKDGDEFWVVLDASENLVEEVPTKKSKLSDELKELYEMLGEVKQVEVPADPPLTRSQFELCKKYWSVNFHPEHDIENRLVKDTFTDGERAWHRACMKEVLEEYSKANRNVAMVADPLQRTIVAKGIEDLQFHPLSHAGMVAIEAVAHLQRGPRQEGDLSYLCTCWDVYLAVEPCPMCAMALIHSRAARVFFAKRCPKVGAFVSTCRVPFLKSLNHHYEVFEVMFEGER